MSPRLTRGRLRRAARLVALSVAGWLCLAGVAAAQAAEVPPLTGRVVDQARLLSPEAETALAAQLEALERDTTDQLVVVTVGSLGGREIEEYGYQLGRAWGIGQAGNDNGALLIVAPAERKVRIEVGYGLEGVLTDALSALIIHNRILPAFREGEYERGIRQGVDALDAQLRLDPAEARARAAEAAAPKAGLPVGPVILIGLILFLMFAGMVGGLSRGGRRRRSSGVAPILIWAASEALRSGGRSGGGGFGGRGGFSGGGGGFGGGGASGGW